ncbi:rRNA-processing protein UTP23 [Astathelohania contejeani]|uniref:rRNA-processing protein UTP23 n=1 Tax=Astathelohania contejeani TaxID=164912 RepID=A0ABQ7HYL0_9MICR|nr:rRNA-processing protein UTP23 [Thelohania contejeani]
MRINKLKKTKKELIFLEKTHGFRKPYQILCEDKFVSRFGKYKLTPRLFESLLGKDCKLFITECSYKQFLSRNETDNRLIKHIKIKNCNHTGDKSTFECINEIVGTNNRFHYFIACDDKSIIENFNNHLHIPFIKLKGSALVLQNHRK